MTKSEKTKWKIAYAITALCFLPSFALALGLDAFQVLAAVAPIAPSPMPIPYQETVDLLAGKSIAYWFLTLAALAIASWTWLFKWVLNQLESQRQAHAAVTAQLIEYMKTDHSDTRTTLTQVANLLERVATALDRKN